MLRDLLLPVESYLWNDEPPPAEQHGRWAASTLADKRHGSEQGASSQYAPRTHAALEKLAEGVQRLGLFLASRTTAAT